MAGNFCQALYDGWTGNMFNFRMGDKDEFTCSGRDVGELVQINIINDSVVGPSKYCSPRYRMPFDSRNEESCVGGQNEQYSSCFPSAAETENLSWRRGADRGYANLSDDPSFPELNKRCLVCETVWELAPPIKLCRSGYTWD